MNAHRQDSVYKENTDVIVDAKSTAKVQAIIRQLVSVCDAQYDQRIFTEKGRGK